MKMLTVVVFLGILALVSLMVGALESLPTQEDIEEEKAFWEAREARIEEKVDWGLNGLETLMLIQNLDGTWDLYGVVDGVSRVQKNVDREFILNSTECRVGLNSPVENSGD